MLNTAQAKVPQYCAWFAQQKVEEIKQTEFPKYFQRESKWVDSFAEIVNKAIKEAFGDFLTKWEGPLSQLIGFTKEEVNPSLEKPTGHSVFTALIYLFSILLVTVRFVSRFGYERRWRYLY